MLRNLTGQINAWRGLQQLGRRQSMRARPDRTCPFNLHSLTVWISRRCFVGKFSQVN
jgi:hypothetical protein